MVPGFNKPLRVIDAAMTEPGNIQRVLARKAIRIDYAFGFDCFFNDRNRRILSGIRDNNDMVFASSPKQTEDRNLARCAASAFAFVGAAKVTFVDINLTGEPRLCLGEL